VVDRTVAVLAGGLSHERDVSLRSGRRLSAALKSEGFAIEEWDTDAGLLERLRTQRPDAVVVALHGGEGENGSVQTVLEMLDVPFVGTGSQGCRRAWDKPTAKALLQNAGFVTPGWVVLPHSTFRELGAQPVLDAMVERLGLPLILKPDQGGSALGIIFELGHLVLAARWAPEREPLLAQAGLISTDLSAVDPAAPLEVAPVCLLAHRPEMRKTKQRNQ